MFDFFKKKKKEEEPSYNPTNIQLIDMRRGFFVDYDLKTWEVLEEFEYDWGNNNFSYEYKLESMGDVCFLSIEETQPLRCVISRKINFNRLDESVEREIKSNERPPKKIVLDGVEYFRNTENAGYFRNISESEWYEFMSWDYLDKTEKQTLTIVQWDDEEFESFTGKVSGGYEFSNIIPRNLDAEK